MSVLAAYGISFQLPPGWEGNAFRHADGEPTVHVASFPLPRADGEFGTRATGGMPHDGLFLALTEYRVTPRELGTGIFAGQPPQTLTSELLDARSLLRPVAGQRGLQRFFSTASRAFCLYVVAGRDSHRRLSTANAVLASLAISSP